MGFVIYGAIAFVVGKIAHIGLLEKIGYYMMIFGVVLWALGFIGIGLPIPLPFGAI